MKTKLAFIFIVGLLFGQARTYAQEHWPNMGPGINLDFSTTEVNKAGYDPGFLEAFQAAGFNTVRYFVRHSFGPETYKRAIDDALERGLTVVITQFGAKTNGKENFVEFWREYADFYRMYPKELVFEIMNEPEMSGHPGAEKLPHGNYKWGDDDSRAVMDWLGEAVVAIRAISPTRIIAIGGTGHNNVEYIKYVSPEYLDYRLPDGSGFAEDKNIWGVFHLYRPSGWSHSPDYAALEEVDPEWKKVVKWHLDEGAAWAKTHKKKVILTEWGTRMYNDREDMKQYFRFLVDEAAKRDIDWMYYCGVFNNAWPFALYSSEKGWDESAEVVEVLTGVYPTVVPPTNQVNNPGFDLDADHWYSTDQVNIGTADGQGVNGSRAMRCMVAFVKPQAPTVWQQSPPNWKWKQKGGMLQLREGNAYTISFYAKAAVNKTKLGVQLGVAPDNEEILFQSELVEIDSELRKYEFTYTHEGESVEDLRFSIVFTERHSEIILDDIKLRGTRPDYVTKN